MLQEADFKHLGNSMYFLRHLSCRLILLASVGSLYSYSTGLLVLSMSKDHEPMGSNEPGPGWGAYSLSTFTYAYS